MNKFHKYIYKKMNYREFLILYSHTPFSLPRFARIFYCNDHHHLCCLDRPKSRCCCSLFFFFQFNSFIPFIICHVTNIHFFRVKITTMFYFYQCVFQELYTMCTLFTQKKELKIISNVHSSVCMSIVSFHSIPFHA